MVCYSTTFGLPHQKCNLKTDLMQVGALLRSSTPLPQVPVLMRGFMSTRFQLLVSLTHTPVTLRQHHLVTKKYQEKKLTRYCVISNQDVQLHGA